MLNIAFCSLMFPEPDHNAGGLRFSILLKMMAKQHRVTLLVPHLDQSSLNRYSDAPSLLEAGVQIPLGYWSVPQHTFRREQFDIALFEFWNCAAACADNLKSVQPWIKTAVDSVDIHYAREEAGLPYGVGSREKTEYNKAREIAIYRQADAVIVTTDMDRETLLREGEFPPFYQLPTISHTRPRTQKERGNSLLFVGGFKHPPNLDGLLWFVREVFPRVQAVIPDVTLTVVGSNPPPVAVKLGEIPGISFVGYVPETTPYLDSAAVSVAPLRFGAGIKGKVMEAMDSGVPVATTPVGVQGLNAVSGEHLTISETEAEYAEAIIHLLRNSTEAANMGMRGQKHIEALCGYEAVERGTAAMLLELCPSRKFVPDAAWEAGRQKEEQRCRVWETLHLPELIVMRRKMVRSVLARMRRR